MATLRLRLKHTWNQSSIYRVKKFKIKSSDKKHPSSFCNTFLKVLSNKNILGTILQQSSHNLNRALKENQYSSKYQTEKTGPALKAPELPSDCGHERCF